MPKISVIVPVYKAEKFLATCIESILNQTYGNLEIILVDDGSPDSCGKICEKYALSDSRVKVVHQKNAGVAAARNVGLDLAEGDYVTFVDSDDYIQPQMYEKMIRCAEHNHCDLVMCDCIKVHNMMISRGAKTVLWGCSINPEVLSNPEIVNDVRQYQLITARESITYNALKKINPNTILVADPAFGLKTAYAEIPSKFINKNMVGINLSPMVQKEEKISGIIMKNYEILIEHILKETDMAIALIPHVIWDDSDDRIPLMQLYERYKKSGRVLVIEDQNCSKLKYAISKCRFFVGARTHSTIAAYSSGIPTLVVGYSVKARGIARDLFGDEEQYSLSVQRLKETDELLKKFRWILENEELIKKQLNSKIPEVIKRALTAKEYVERLL